MVLTVVNTSVPCLRSYLLSSGIATRYLFVDGSEPESAIKKYIFAFLNVYKPDFVLQWINRNVELWFSAKGIQPFDIGKLNVQQRNFVNTSTASGRRKIRGAAGSGKSLLLAARGARLLKERKRVLFLTYNIVASRYLQEKVSEILAHTKDSLDGMQAVFLHFHGLLRRYSPYDPPAEATRVTLNHYLDVGWCEEASTALNKNTPIKFDAVFIDEGQDFCLEWWNFACKLLKQGGEIILAADKTQNIYNRASWTENPLTNTGLSGRWFELSISYRLPDRLITPIREFIESFISDDDAQLPEPSNQGFLNDLSMRWIQLHTNARPEDTASLAFKEYLRLKEQSTTHAGAVTLSDKDFVFLTCTNDCGYALEDEFSLQDVVVYSTIGNREAKLGFSMRCPAVKICTVRSFKGLESRALIIVAEPGISAVELYVAMSRLVARDGFPSYLSVLCMDDKFASYGKKWKNYGGEFVELTHYDISRLVKHVIIDKALHDPDELLIDKEFYTTVMQNAYATNEAGMDIAQTKSLNVNTNVHNTHMQNIAYIHDYFFRSYTENFVFWKNILSNTAYSSHLKEKDSLHLLFYGCGTGGDIAGFIDTLNIHGLFSGKRITIRAVDGNADALKICESIIKGLCDFRGFDMLLRLETTVCHAGADGFPLPDLHGQLFDIIETSKMVNEILHINYGMYFKFLETIVKPFLVGDGVALIADVPVKRYVRMQNDWGGFSGATGEWTPKLMTQAVSNFTKKNSDFRVLLPTVCDGCQAYCYSAKLYKYRFFDSVFSVRSPVCCRLLVGAQLWDKLQPAVDGEAYFTTCFRKDGTATCCQKQGKTRNISHTKAQDGYMLW